MKTTFTLTPSDLSRLQKVIGQRLKRQVGLLSSFFFLRVFVWCCIGLAGTTFARVLRENPEVSRPLEYMAVLLVAAILAAVAMPYVHQAMLRKYMLSPGGAFLSPQTVQLTENALVIEGGSGRAEIPWSSILSREQDETNYYLFVDAMQAVVLPRSTTSAFCRELERLTSLSKSEA